MRGRIQYGSAEEAERRRAGGLVLTGSSSNSPLKLSSVMPMYPLAERAITRHTAFLSVMSMHTCARLRVYIYVFVCVSVCVCVCATRAASATDGGRGGI